MFSQKSDIQGYITDENKLSFSGAIVILNQGEFVCTSDTIGKYQFRNVPLKEYEILVTAVGYKKESIVISSDTLRHYVNFSLSPLVQQLQEVTVNANNGDKLKRTESIAIQIIDNAFLKEAKASSLMQTLNAIPGVNSMDVGTGISKPMIRGMGYYRVVVAQNGIKHEGQQWSNHHGVSIDQQSVEHVEVVKGPASLQFGTDAMGGVINVLTTHIPTNDGLEGEISFNGKSNSGWLGTSANASFRQSAFFSNISLGYNSYGDFKIPETESFLVPTPVSASEASHKVKLGNRMHNTAGNERAISLNTGLVKEWGNSMVEFSYFSNQMGFFDWQGLQNDSLRNSHAAQTRDLKLPWQKVDNYSVYHFTNLYFNKDKLELAIGYQSNRSSEFSYLDDRTGNRNNALNYYRSRGNLELELDLQTFTANSVYTLNRIEGHKTKIGVNTQYQLHHTDGYSHILAEYNRFSSGLFITHQYQYSENWIWNSGVRFDNNAFKMKESLNPDPEYSDSIFNPSIDKNYPGLAFSMGFNFLPSQNTTFKVNIGKSYRVPSAYELGAYGLHRHEGRFEKGNVNNEPEQAWQLDLGYEQKWNTLKLSLSPFLNYFTNYLFLNPTPELRTEGQIYEYQQANALLAGGETSLDYYLTSQLNFNVGAEYVYAVNLDLMGALPFTPPFNVQTGLNYQFTEGKKISKTKIGIELVSVARQKYTVPNELTTPGYECLNLHAATEIKIGSQRVSIVFNVKNILDTKYYNHISFYRRLRIPEPGRDFQLFVNIPF